MLHRVAIFYLKTKKEPIRIPLQFPFQNIICRLLLFISDSKIHLSPNQREYQIKNESITRPRVKPRWLRYKSGIYLNNLMSGGRHKNSSLVINFWNSIFTKFHYTTNKNRWDLHLPLKQVSLLGFIKRTNFSKGFVPWLPPPPRAPTETLFGTYSNSRPQLHFSIN